MLTFPPAVARPSRLPRSSPQTREVTWSSRSRRIAALLFGLCAGGVAGAEQAQAPASLGAAVSRLEERLGADPAAAVAGAESTQRYAAGIVSAALAVYEQSRHLDKPFFARNSGIDGRAGLVNPDNIYETALLSDGGQYRILGRRGTHAMLTLQLLDAYPAVALGRNVAAFDLDEAGVAKGQDFELVLGGERRPGLWFPLLPGTRALLVRQTFEDWTSERPSILAIERLDRGAPAVDLGVPGSSPGDYVAAADRLWNVQYLPMIRNLPLNELTPPRDSEAGAGGLGGQQSVMGRFRITPDEALIVTVRKSGARYQGIQLGDPWFVTPNFVDHQASLTRAQSAVDADGYLRYVISLADPGVANWLDPAGFGEGFVFIRWQGLDVPLEAADAPTITRVAFAELAKELPAGTRRISPAERAEAIAARQLVPLRR